MNIARIRSWQEHVELLDPFEISYATEESATLHFVEIRNSDGLRGYGSAKPSEHVTGESAESCAKALLEVAPEVLEGTDLRQLPMLVRNLENSFPGNPAARAALDMALHDLLARSLKLPLSDYLGRCIKTLPTSVTLGIKDVEKTMEEAHEWIDQGFSVLKVKLGRELEEDLEKIKKLRSDLPHKTIIRVDPNQGYSTTHLLRFCSETKELGIEFIEQPLAADKLDEMRKLPLEIRERLAADESLHNPTDALNLLNPEPACGIFNIKLMKCGGILRGRQIAAIADAASIPLMWGCNTESRLSLSAALHAAFSSPNTRYLDLDGDLDLIRDPARGGYRLENGMMSLTGEIGLGVELD